jgi:hypothetical protein
MSESLRCVKKPDIILRAEAALETFKIQIKTYSYLTVASYSQCFYAGMCFA